MKNFLALFLIFSLVISFIAFKVKNAILKTALINYTNSLTNLKLDIDDVKLAIAKHTIDIKNLELYNPDGFEEAAMADIPSIYIDYSLLAAMGKRVHFYVLKIDLRELLIIRNQKGSLNFMSIKPLKEPSGIKEKNAGPLKFKVDKLYLSVGKVVYKDYYNQEIPMVKVYNINLGDQLFENVNDPKALVSAVIHRSLAQTDIYQLINFNVNLLKENIKDVIDKGGTLLKDFSSTASDVVKDTAKDIKDTIKTIFAK